MNRVSIDKIDLTNFDTSLKNYTPIECMLLAKRLMDSYPKDSEFRKFIRRGGSGGKNSDGINRTGITCPSLKDGNNICITNCIVAIKQGLKIDNNIISVKSKISDEWIDSSRAKCHHPIEFNKWIDQSYLEHNEYLEYFHDISNVEYVESDEHYWIHGKKEYNSDMEIFGE